MEFKPRATVKPSHDDDIIYLIYQVRDQFVPCLMRDFNSQVYKDASVEFFFPPDATEPLTWIIEIALPFEILHNYSAVTPPRSGCKWRADFYKSAENNSDPNWLSWAPIRSPLPNLHFPNYFGELEFE